MISIESSTLVKKRSDSTDLMSIVRLVRTFFQNTSRLVPTQVFRDLSIQGSCSACLSRLIDTQKSRLHIP
ncbi:MAG: hypothetical protein QOE55_7538, partial [Acidobacteriaceae bacterium]|nr:hypothetical protein [Acidobacteriaceae bacterium]